MGVKEKKLVVLRKSYVCHFGLSDLQRRWLAFKLTLGFDGGIMGENSKIFNAPAFKYLNRTIVSQILPWLYIGQFESACNMNLLTSLKVTHIINASSEIENVFPPHFVYMKMNLKDDSHGKIEKYWDEIFDFFDRVLSCKVVLFVHWVAGV